MEIQMNEGYIIIDSIYIGGSGFVLGVSSSIPNMYVTWEHKYDLTLFTILYEDFIEYLSYKIGSVFCVADELNLDILQAQRKIFNNTIIIQSKIGDIPMLANLKKMMSKLEWHSFCKWYEYSLWAAILRWPIYFLLGYYEYADQRFCKSDDFFKKEVLTQRIEKQIQIYYQSFNLL